MTAEPRMEDLLASIRKAIHDDIGEVPASLSARTTGTLYKGATRELHVKGREETVSAAAEIQQLRDKIQRSRTSDSGLAAAPPRANQVIRPEPPARRSWRDLEPPAPLRPAIIEPEAPVRYEHGHGVPSAAKPTVWQDAEAPALPLPRDQRQRFEPAMMSGEASQAVHTAFSRLADTMLSRATGERSIEDITRELLRGMLKQWLDEHLPALVERLVREEIERVARRG